MGKKKLAPGKKLQVVPFRLLDSEKAACQAAADRAGVTLSEWGRRVMVAAADQKPDQPDW